MPKVCPRCGTVNDDLSPVCIRCGYNFGQPPFPPQPPKKRKLPIIAVVIAVIIVIALGGVLLLKPYLFKSPTSTSSVSPTTVTATKVSKAYSFAYGIEFNGTNQYFITRDYNITINGKNTSVGLFSYVALKYHAETIAVLAYLTPNTQGVLVGLSANTLPFNFPPYGWTPLIYMGGGKLVIGEFNSATKPHYLLFKSGIGQLLPVPSYSIGQRTMAVNITKPGLYWIVLEEWTNSTDTFVAGYINGTLIDIMYAPTPNGSSLFGESGPYQYNFVGISYTCKWVLTNGGWYPFNGSIASVIVYPFVLSQQQIDQLVSGNIPGGYFAFFIASSNYYNQKVWYAMNNQSIYMTAVNDPQLVKIS